MFVLHHLAVKQSKCVFDSQSVAYLGHVISASGVAMDHAKVEAVQAWPTPQTPRALHGFLGLTGYYRKFIHDYGNIAGPLTQLLKKEAFAWSHEAITAFTALKQVLTTGPILQLPDFDKLFIVNCDASGLVSALSCIRRLDLLRSTIGRLLHNTPSWWLMSVN
jgi:hypothetical protein